MNLLYKNSLSFQFIKLINSTMKFNSRYFIAFIILLLTEIVIAKTSGFIRHTFGDFLAVIGVYFFVKSFFDISPIKLGVGVLVFSFIVEFLQMTTFLDVIGLSDNKYATIIFGATFSFGDLLAYTLGVITIVFIDNLIINRYDS